VLVIIWDSSTTFRLGTANWLGVDLQGVRSNRFAVGAHLTAKVDDLLVYREVQGSEGFGATCPYRQHFGLGKKDEDRLAGNPVRAD